MAAYAALLSLSQTTLLNSNQDDQFLYSHAAREKLRSIHDYVSSLILSFKEFPEKVNRWEGRIRDVAYRTEDIIEGFIWEEIQSPLSGMAPSRIEFEHQLQNVSEKIGLIAGEVSEERPPYLPPSSSSRLASTGKDAVVGLQEDLLALKDRLCGHSDPQLQVISIVGMGGIGKSTLAKTLYDDRYMFETFHIRAWVVVSQDYTPHRFRKILLDLMRLLEKEQTSGDEMDESDIALKVYQKLKGSRYLIVIDDVWSPKVLDDIRHMFPNDSNGSRIILTTRLSDVATYPYYAGPVHEMKFLNDSQSWDLLRQKLFGKGDCPSELEEVGKEIARRCAGLPLAVVLVAGVLSHENKTRASWEEIAENVNRVVGREIEGILSLSYNYLPHHLGPCFLYIGGFPEDVNIGASRLIRLWVAEGFLKHQETFSKSLEEVGEEYLEDLVKRNLVIVASRKIDGKIKRCSLHDMVRGLCIREAQEEKFLHVMNGRVLPRGLMDERRVSFSRPDIDKIWGTTIRTILCFQIRDFPSLPAFLGAYKLLRVLDALEADTSELPSEVFELYHLRYIALSGYFDIPSAISNLVNLQSLIIHVKFGKRLERYAEFDSLPLEIWRMPRLRHLFVHAPYVLPHPLEESNYLPLENLLTLLHIKDLVWNQKIIEMIPNVKKLRLTHTSNQEFHLHLLKYLHQLEKLEVVGYFDFSWTRQRRSFPSTLKKLTLLGGGFHWKDMSSIGSLVNLEVLKLLEDSCVGETWETADGDFPRLNFLLIDDSHLKQWLTQSNPLPALKRLVLRYCRFLMEIPEAIGEIATLELIEVDRCTESVVESAKKIKEDQEGYANYDLQVRTKN